MTDAAISSAAPSAPSASSAAVPATSADRADERSAATDDTLAVAAGDFQTFLSLLTTQMRNQDPLNPVDSTEFVAQLASFSAVEQQIRANDRLDSILAAITAQDGAGLAQWIGKEVEAAARAPFDDDPIAVSVDPVADATRALLVVRDASGAEVARLPVDAAATGLTWEGETANGKAPAGLYAFSVEYFDDENLLEARDGRIFARVKEVRLGGDAPMLVLEGGDEITSDAVIAVRDAAA